MSMSASIVEPHLGFVCISLDNVLTKNHMDVRGLVCHRLSAKELTSPWLYKSEWHTQTLRAMSRVERPWDTIRIHVGVCGPATAMVYGKVHGSWILLPPKGLHRVVPSPHRPQHVALGRTGCALASCSTQESRSKPFPHMPCDGMDEGKLTLHNCCRKDSWP